MKKPWIRLAAVGAVLAVVGAYAALPAGAAETPPVGYGFDDTSHIIVGGGSDTTFFTMQQLASDWQRSDFGSTGGCKINTSAGSANVNGCAGPSGQDVTDLGNWQHDTIAQANPAGSSAGIASLNSVGNYQGTANGSPANVDFARSSRAPKTSGGAGSCPAELTCDTFWGFGEDGVQVTVFNSRVGELQSDSTGLTPDDLFNIWTCVYTSWSQVPDLGITPGSAQDGPIVPWTMNSASGTEATFQTYIQQNATATGHATFNPDNNSCDRTLGNLTVGTGGTSQPFENDVKPLVNDPPTLGTTNTDPNNPVNWIWWGSFGVMSTFPFLSSSSRGPTTSGAAPVNGILPSQSFVLSTTYPIVRTLYHVTRKADATCPTSAPSVCDFVDNPGPTLPSGSGNDLNVTNTALGNAGGNSTGVSGAVREFTRWLCRPGAADQQADPYLGKNYSVLITSALGASGFTVVPSSLQTSGSRCQVLS